MVRNFLKILSFTYKRLPNGPIIKGLKHLEIQESVQQFSKFRVPVACQFANTVFH